MSKMHYAIVHDDRQTTDEPDVGYGLGLEDAPVARASALQLGRAF
jgi:hypothetical protein